MKVFICIAVFLTVFEGGDTAVACIFFTFDADGTSYDRCGGPKYDCARRNPCTAPACSSSLTYPGKSLKNYVQCGPGGSCLRKQCPRRQVYSEEQGGCVEKTLWGEFSGSGDTSIYSDNSGDRCSYEKYDCRDRNPCDPEVCVSGQYGYPGPTPNRYVGCVDGECEELTCGKPNIWNNDAQACVPEIEPVCWNQFCDAREPCQDYDNVGENNGLLWRHLVPLNNMTTGTPYLDAKMDCMESEGTYYTVLPGHWYAPRRWWGACYGPGGLCDVLDSNVGGNYYIDRLVENNYGEMEWRFAPHTDGTAPEDCVALDHKEEAESLEECISMGGTIILWFEAQSWGRCDYLPSCQVNVCSAGKCYEKGSCPQ